MGFTNYPKLVEVRDRAMSPQAQAFEEFEGELTWENVARYNRGRASWLRRLHGGAPSADVEVRPFGYRSGDYAGEGLVYRPRAAGVLPAAVYIHGGGWTTLGKECYEYECAAFAQQGECVVFNIDYRLAIGGVKIPTCHEDCYAALLEVARRAPDYGADPSRLAVMGDSAGGNLAAGIALMSRDRGGPRIAYQVLCYPGVGFDLGDLGSEGAGDLTVRMLVERCFARPEDSQSPYVSPILDARKAETPPTMLVVGTCDFLLDDDLRYARGLVSAGVDVDVELFQGMPHGFIQMTTPPGVESVSAIARKLKSVLA